METPEKVETPEGYKNVKIDGEDVLCREVDITKEYGDALKESKEYKKKAVVDARQATEHEEISTTQDGMKNYADEGDWIIQNPGEDPYVFGSKNDAVEVRQQKFAKKYELNLIYLHLYNDRAHQFLYRRIADQSWSLIYVDVYSIIFLIVELFYFYY